MAMLARKPQTTTKKAPTVAPLKRSSPKKSTSKYKLGPKDFNTYKKANGKILKYQIM